MNFSLNLNYTLNSMQNFADEETHSKLKSIINFIKNTRLVDPRQRNINSIIKTGINLFDKTGDICIFFMRNINGEVTEISCKFKSIESKNRNIENNIYDFYAKEYNQQQLTSLLKPNKSTSIGYLTHTKSGRAGRDLELVSKYSLIVQKDDESTMHLFEVTENFEGNNASGEDSVVM